MFIIAGIGSLIVWYLRKNLPESPRWLEAQGRTAEAEALLKTIEKDVELSAGTLPPPKPVVPAPQLSAAAMFKPPILQSLLVGSWCLITINTLIFGFVIFLPQFFLRQGLTITNSLGYTVVLASASLVGCALGAYLSDSIGRRWSIITGSVLTIVFDLCPLQCKFRPGNRAQRWSSADCGNLYPDRTAVRRLHAGAFSDRNSPPRERDLQYAWACGNGRLTVCRGISDGELSDDRTGSAPDDRCIFLGRRTRQALT